MLYLNIVRLLSGSLGGFVCGICFFMAYKTWKTVRHTYHSVTGAGALGTALALVGMAFSSLYVAYDQYSRLNTPITIRLPIGLAATIPLAIFVSTAIVGSLKRKLPK